MDNIVLYIIGALTLGIIFTILLEIYKKKKQPNIEYESIFPSIKDEWTEKAFNAETAQNRTIFQKMSNSMVQTGAAASGSGADRSAFIFNDDGYDANDPYLNPGVDPLIDETYHGMDRGMGIVNPPDDFHDHHDHHDHHDFHDHSDPHHF